MRNEYCFPFGFPKEVNLKFNLLWNDCSNFSFLGFGEDLEAERDNQQPSIFIFHIRKLWFAYYYICNV